MHLASLGHVRLWRAQPLRVEASRGRGEAGTRRALAPEAAQACGISGTRGWKAASADSAARGPAEAGDPGVVR